jgi:DegV family protein with EDD domain
MQNVLIVTDSCAHFPNPQVLQQFPITVVPNRITIAGKTYRESVDLHTEEAFRLLAHQPYAPSLHAPSVADYLAVYSRLARDAAGIISIHASREMLPSWQNAREAAQQLAGRCEIAVIDSQTISTGQALLVQLAVQYAEQAQTMDDIIRELRGAVDRIYSVYCVETMGYLLQNSIMAASHTILGTMIGIRPFLAIEAGRFKPMEKARTRVHVIERLVEFAAEFSDLDDAVIVQNRAPLTEQTRILQDRLALEFPGRHFPFTAYGPSLAALIGTDAAGLVVLESELDRIEDEF